MRNKTRRENRKANIKEPEKIKVPITIEANRETDKSFVFSIDKELEEAEEVDEFSPFFNEEKETKIFLTTSERPHEETFRFLKEVKEFMPKCYFYPRQ